MSRSLFHINVVIKLRDSSWVWNPKKTGTVQMHAYRGLLPASRVVKMKSSPSQGASL